MISAIALQVAAAHSRGTGGASTRRGGAGRGRAGWGGEGAGRGGVRRVSQGVC